jgi:hypothetical protein
MLHIPERLLDLERLCELAYRVSALSGDSQYSYNHHEGEKLFTRILLTATSIVRLLRTDACIPQFPNMIDVYGVASLSRDLIEAYDAMHYLYIEPVSESEKEFRSFLQTLHEYSEQETIYAALGIHDTGSLGGGWNWIIQTCKRVLEANPIFLGLTDKQQKELLKGRKPFLPSANPVSKFQYVDQVKMRAVYKLLSNMVHSHPLATSRLIPALRPRKLENNDILRISVTVSVFHLAIGIKEYAAKRRVGSRWGNPDKRYVRKLLTVMDEVFAEFSVTREGSDRYGG